jgi:hypothetical protein
MSMATARPTPETRSADRLILGECSRELVASEEAVGEYNSILERLRSTLPDAWRHCVRGVAD